MRDIIEAKFGSYNGIPDEIKRDIENNEKKIDIWKNNVVEDSYSQMEGESVKWLDSLKKQDSSFYYIIDKQTGNEGFNGEKYSFLLFLCLQHFRTKAEKERWVSTFGEYLEHLQGDILGVRKENIELENIQPLLFWHIATSCTYYLWKKDAHLTVLVNKTDLPFIISDQPVINLKADYQNLGTETTELIFYYPISLEIAITVNDENIESRIEFDISEVDI